MITYLKPNIDLHVLHFQFDFVPTYYKRWLLAYSTGHNSTALILLTKNSEFLNVFLIKTGCLIIINLNENYTHIYTNCYT